MGPMGGMGGGSMPGGPPSGGMAPPTPAMPNMPQGPAMQQVKMCGKCGKELPSTLTAGDKCPHCGVFFSFDDTNGKKASGFFNLTGSAQRGAIKLAVSLVCLIAGGIGWAFKKSRG